MNGLFSKTISQSLSKSDITWRPASLTAEMH